MLNLGSYLAGKCRYTVGTGKVINRAADAGRCLIVAAFLFFWLKKRKNNKGEKQWS